MGKTAQLFLVGILYVAALFLLVRPNSGGPALVNNVASGLTGIINASTGGGGW